MDGKLTSPLGLPLKEGLKQSALPFLSLESDSTPVGNSIKRRIETHKLRLGSWDDGLLPLGIPLKEGLKQVKMSPLGFKKKD